MSTAMAVPPALPLADDALILSHRLAEWAGHAPVLEEEMALANIALDLLGHARSLLSLLGDEDELAFQRDERAFRNVQLVEQPNGDFALTIARQLYFSCYQQQLYRRLPDAGGDLGELAAKAGLEVAYHQQHAERWTLRLGDGTPLSHERIQRALDELWVFTDELFRPIAGLALDWQAIEGEWRVTVEDVLRRATLTLPQGPGSHAWKAGAGRQGLHTETFGRMLAEMQHLHRGHPGASW